MNEKLTLDNGDLLPEYDLDYRKAKPNHFAAQRYNKRMKPLSETNPYLRDPEKRRQMIVENALASSAFEGARGLVSSPPLQPYKRRSMASRKKPVKSS